MTRIVLLVLTTLFITNTFERIETCHSPYYPPTNCSDKLDHYECICGQGQSWNGYSCVVDAVDSRLVFNGSRFPSYIELDSKTFPRISEITISFWLRIWPQVDSSPQQTILFYRTDDVLPVVLVSLTDSARLHVEILNNIYDVSVPLALKDWHHVAIAHNLSRSDSIKVMINSSLVLVLISSKIGRYDRQNRPKVIDSGGDFFVGQAIRPTNFTGTSIPGDLEFDSQRAFYGELAFLNIWQKMLSENELHQLAMDCHVQKQECGDAVAWMDFVNDIKGEIQIHWPSGIYALFANCPTEQWLHEACDNYCRKLEGPHCKNESHLSIIWGKAIAGKTVVQHCPGHVKNGSIYRTCQRIEQVARWAPVDYSECTHPLINTIDQELEINLSDKEEIFTLRDKCAFLAETTSMNLTATELYSSIDLILLIEQIERLTKVLTSHFDSLTEWYSISDESFYLGDINATLSIHRYLVEAISNLIDERHHSIWNETNPLGNDFLRLITSLQRLTHILAQVLTNDCQLFPGCSCSVQTENINQTIQILTRQQLDTFVYVNEPTQTRVAFTAMKKSLANNKTILHLDEKLNVSTWYAVSITSLRTAHLFMPNLRLGRVSKFDNINSHVVSVDIKLRKPIQRSEHLSTLAPADAISVVLTMGYLKFENISDNRCVSLDTINAFTNEQYKSTLFRQWHWQNLSSICNLSQVSTPDKGVCSCLISNGTFSITSDLFDPNWRPPEVRLHPLNIFSYVGFCLHISFALFTLLMLNYLQTRSSAAYIHKHYSFVLCCSQLMLIFAFNGIPHHHAVLCRAVACLTHFFILSSYCWLMNEAFNLYIQITYTTHPAVAGAGTALSDASSKYRFLGMGYILPLCIVALLASTKKTSYFMRINLRLCFVDLDDWFKIYFIPISAIIFITIMVMIFSAKQQHESSYTKNEKANEVIVTYTGGIWSQLFLITISWSLAILPYFYDETILRLLHCFFSSLQGGFLFLSFFLFNDEIRRHYRDRRRQLRRIQLMELPYRTSAAGSEDQRSSIFVPSVSPTALVDHPATSTPTSPTKVNAFTSTVSMLINRNRNPSSRRDGYDEMKSVSRRSSSKEPSKPIDDNVINEEDDEDYRVTVV